MPFCSTNIKKSWHSLIFILAYSS